MAPKKAGGMKTSKSPKRVLVKVPVVKVVGKPLSKPKKEPFDSAQDRPLKIGRAHV